MELDRTPTTPNVTVAIVNFNGGGLLERCLSALDRQTLRPAGIIVVDNGSSDSSTAGMEERHRGVRVIRLGENLGFAAASNLAVREAAGSEWVALVNPDVFPEPTWLATLMRAAEERPECASFASCLVSAEETEKLDGTGDVYHVSGLAWRRDHGKVTSSAVSRAEETFAPCAAAALYRRDVFLDAGGFDERFFCYFEDVDLGFRLRLLGHRCWYVPDAIVGHLGSAVTGRRSDFSVYHGHRNLVWTYFKNMPESLFWLYLPQHLLLNLIAVVWFSIRGQGRTIVAAKAHSLRELPRVWKQRRAIQSNRRLDPVELRRLMVRGWLRPYLRRGLSG
jgi:GT2 family glycosyltransferase